MVVLVVLLLLLVVAIFIVHIWRMMLLERTWLIRVVSSLLMLMLLHAVRVSRLPVLLLPPPSVESHQVLRCLGQSFALLDLGRVKILLHHVRGRVHRPLGCYLI